MTYEEFQALHESVKEAMLWAKEQQEHYNEKDWSKRVQSFSYKPSDIINRRESPIWADEDAEDDYRRGFQHGVAYSVELIEMLRTKGFVRASEISNIIAHWERTDLWRWRGRADADVRKNDYKLLCGHLTLKHESWARVRRRILMRDGHKCVDCGESSKELQVHHKIPVCEGGIPSDDNLETLCIPCHDQHR